MNDYIDFRKATIKELSEVSPEGEIFNVNREVYDELIRRAKLLQRFESNVKFELAGLANLTHLGDLTEYQEGKYCAYDLMRMDLELSKEG